MESTQSTAELAAALESLNAATKSLSPSEVNALDETVGSTATVLVNDHKKNMKAWKASLLETLRDEVTEMTREDDEYN